jgi:hypothetical protein
MLVGVLPVTPAVIDGVAAVPAVPAVPLRWRLHNKFLHTGP